MATNWCLTQAVDKDMNFGYEMDYLNINKKAWDKRTDVHVESEFYDVASFKSGKCSLNPIELEQLRVILR